MLGRDAKIVVDMTQRMDRAVQLEPQLIMIFEQIGNAFAVGQDGLDSTLQSIGGGISLAPEWLLPRREVVRVAASRLSTPRSWRAPAAWSPKD
jgi:hypothetical protein